MESYTSEDSRYLFSDALISKSRIMSYKKSMKVYASITMPVDLIGPLSLARGQAKYAVVAVDYFTKWAAAEPLATISEAKITNFVWTNIVCRFENSYAIITDNGKQFDYAKFRDFCA